MGMAIIVGLIGGLTAVAFHDVLAFTQERILGRLAGFPPYGSGKFLLPHFLFFLVPALGGILQECLFTDLLLKPQVREQMR